MNIDMIVIKIILMILLMSLNAAEDTISSLNTNPQFDEPLCHKVLDITYDSAEEFSLDYELKPKHTIGENTSIKLKLYIESSITVNDTRARLIDLGNHVFKLELLKYTKNVRLAPNLKFLFNIECCQKLNSGYFERHLVGAEKRPEVPNLFCGKRQAINELIVNGVESKPGDWPWHVAIFRLERATLKYICGGTLVSNIFVLTAAHCVTINGAAVLPENLGISLGKHYLIGGDVGSQEKQVRQVIVHEEFVHKTLDNDIALLKMKTSVEYNSVVQPACIWFDKAAEKLPPGQVLGTVTGWGFDQTESLSRVLREATMPIVQDIDCIRSKPAFYSIILSGKKFCAGYRNGTSACNGDSGGGFFVYIPNKDSPSKNHNGKGSWYVRGIVSIGVARQDTKVCDPNEYVAFTDIAAYTDWIHDNMD